MCGMKEGDGVKKRKKKKTFLKGEIQLPSPTPKSGKKKLGKGPRKKVPPILCEGREEGDAAATPWVRTEEEGDLKM